MISLMFDSVSEHELIIRAQSIFDEIIKRTKSGYNSLSPHFLSYEHLKTICSFIIELKQLYIVTALQLRSLGIDNISAHAFISGMKSECASIKILFNRMIESIGNVYDEYYTSIQNISNWFDEFEKETI